MYFDDLPKGTSFDTGTREVSRDDIIAFAQQWDPQPFHLTDEGAAASPYGRLIASGFHTILIAFNLTLEASDWSESSLGSPGMADVRWIAPVYPGDVLRVRGTVAEARASKSRPNRGFVEIDYEILNQHDALVASYRATHMLRKRPG